MPRRLFKFHCDVKHAEAFIDDGEMLFSSLSVFRDWEDNSIREDRHEGVSVYRPPGGLVINNHTQGKTFVLSDHALVSTVNQAEISVFCLSRSMSHEMRTR